MLENKEYSVEVKNRFFEEMDRIVGRRDTNGKKATANDFAAIVGQTSSNLTRARGGYGSIPLEACCRLCAVYGTDPAWLFLGHEQKSDEIKESERIQQLDGMIKRLQRMLDLKKESSTRNITSNILTKNAHKRQNRKNKVRIQ